MVIAHNNELYATDKNLDFYHITPTFRDSGRYIGELVSSSDIWYCFHKN